MFEKPEKSEWELRSSNIVHKGGFGIYAFSK